MILTFAPDGTGQCLYSEDIDLASIGTLEMRRASNIEFDAASQEWEVRTENEGTIFSDPSRQRCLDWERKHFEEQL